MGNISVIQDTDTGTSMNPKYVALNLWYCVSNIR